MAMTTTRTLLLFCATLLFTVWGCSTPLGSVALRADGTPGPEACPDEALRMMRLLHVQVGDAADVELDVNQTDASPITLYEGPVESMLLNRLGPFGAPDRLYGRIWTSGPQVVVRYYQVRSTEGDVVPICAVARMAKGQLRKRPESKPGTAIIEDSRSAIYVVDAFR